MSTSDSSGSTSIFGERPNKTARSAPIRDEGANPFLEDKGKGKATEQVPVPELLLDDPSVPISDLVRALNSFSSIFPNSLIST